MIENMNTETDSDIGPINTQKKFFNKSFVFKICIIFLVFIIGILFIIQRQIFIARDWNNFSNAKFGFSFKYPKGWEILDLHDASSTSYEEDAIEYLGLSLASPKNPRQNRIYLIIEKKDPNKSIQQLVNEKNGGLASPTPEKMIHFKINGYPALKIMGDVGYPEKSKFYSKYTKIYLQKGNLLFQLGTNSSSKNEDYLLSTLDDIFSTFKILDDKKIYNFPTPTIPVSFKKRNFNLSDSLNGNKYPEEIINIPETDLVDISCRYYQSFQLANGAIGYEYFDEISKKSRPLSKVETDLKIYNILEKKDNEVFSKSPLLIFCDTKDKRTIVEYSTVVTTAGGGANPSDMNIALFSNNVLSKSVKIPYENFGYYACRQPLELTKNNQFYIACGGGEGGCARTIQTIYKIDLNNFVSQRLRRCTSLPDGSTTATCGNPLVTCQ